MAGFEDVATSDPAKVAQLVLTIADHDESGGAWRRRLAAAARPQPPHPARLTGCYRAAVSGEENATSFGSVAGSYERVRPGPAPDAVDWLVPAGCAVAVDRSRPCGTPVR
jgi:hypothetical protein